MGDDVSGRKGKRPLKGASVGFAARHPAPSDVIARDWDLQVTYACLGLISTRLLSYRNLGVARRGKEEEGRDTLKGGPVCAT